MTAIQVDRVGSRWIARSSYEQKDIVKAAGFRWDPDRRCWWTDSAEKAAKLSNSDALKREVAEKAAAQAASVVASRAAAADIDIPIAEGQSYLPFQRAGIAYAMGRQRVLIADEMGLGKTIQAIGIINADTSIKRVLIVCPASLKLNWRNELRKFLARDMSIAIAHGKQWPGSGFDIVIMNVGGGNRCDSHGCVR